MKKAVIFDLDGTLADTLEDIARSVNDSLAGRGLPVHPVDDFRLMVGNGFRNLVKRALPAGLATDTLVDEIRIEASASYGLRCLESTRLYEGVAELVSGLSARGVAMAVLSNKPHELTLRVVEGLFPARPFAIVRGEHPDFARKPDPASALDILARLGVPPEGTLYLGDSDVDMATAIAAGLTALGAGWGFRGADELRRAGAEAVLVRPGELPDYL